MCACVVCKRKEKHVRFDKSVATAQCGGESEGAWWEEAAQIEGVLSGSAGVVTLMLEEDSVSRLHGASANVPPPYSS
jgi:hypothetical protein